MNLSKRQKILIADDVDLNRQLLTDLLEDHYDIIEAKDGNEALLILQERTADINLLLLDMVMPGRDGMEVLKVMNDNGWINEIPVVMISSETMPDTIRRAYKLGATDFISRPFDQVVVETRVRNTILLYDKQRRLSELVAEQILEKTRNSSLLIAVLSHIVEFRNGESGMHILHINIITNLLLRTLIKRASQYNYLENNIDIISTASAMHDIGKITIPDTILNKPGKFTPEEFEIMKQHSMSGAQILEKVSFRRDEPLLKYAYEICRWHHERWDGRGYPDKLKGDEIPISAQVVALADVYDALTSERCYKKAIPHKEAVNMIYNGECGSFNPILLECLRDVEDQLPSEFNRFTWNHQVESDFSKIFEITSKDEEHPMYTQTFRQISYEHMKSKFFESLLDGIVFEYAYNPRMLKFRPDGAKKLGLPRIIADLDNAGKYPGFVSQENWEYIQKQFYSGSPDKTTFDIDADLTIDGKRTHCQISLQQIWHKTTDGKPVPVSAYGLARPKKGMEEK